MEPRPSPPRVLLSSPGPGASTGRSHVCLAAAASRPGAPEVSAQRAAQWASFPGPGRGGLLRFWEFS